MADVAESKVTGIIKILNVLEDDLDSLTGKVGDMKKQLNVKTLSEIDTLLGKTREMATKEAEVLINTSKEKANTESAKIAQKGDSKLAEIESNVNSNFDDMVKHVVWCGKNVRISADTPILFENKVIAVGKAILSSEMISDFNRGVAIKVRDSLKSRKEEIVV